MTTPSFLAVHLDPFPPKERAKHADGWVNSYMGYGTWRDKTSHTHHFLSRLLSDEELSGLYYTDDIAAKIIEKRPEEAFRLGYTVEDPDDAERGDDLTKRAAALNLNGKFQEAWTWARCFGSSLVILGIVGGDPATPLVEEKARDIKFLNVVDRRYATVEKAYSNPLQPNYGEPEIYRIWGLDGSFSRVHESRTIRFDATFVDPVKRRELSGWSYSSLQRPYEVVRQFAQSFAAGNALVADASQAVFKMKGLMQMIASGEHSKLQTRMQLVDMSRSAAKAVLLDADGEEFNRIATSFQGLPEMLDRFAARLAASLDMPVTLLMGTTPAGDNATGASDFKHWYDSISANQKKDIEPKVLRVLRILSQGKAKNLKLCWAPLEAPNKLEQAQIEKTEAETHDIEIQRGVLFPEEVALAKYGKSTNGQIVIDEEARKASLEAEQELALNPPAPVDPNALPPNADPNAQAPGYSTTQPPTPNATSP